MKLPIFRTPKAPGTGGETVQAATWRGQSVVEMAIMLPLLMVLFSIVIDGGLAINGWIRVNTAARDATRFAMDAGRRDDVKSLVQSKLAGIDFGSTSTYTGSTQIDIFIIKGSTDSSGAITTWSVDPVLSSGYLTGPRVARATIQTRLASQGGTSNQNIAFTVVEVDYQYTPLMANLVARGAKIPMSSYAIVQQY